MRIDVTTEDYEKGERGENVRCMVAVALERQTGRSWHVRTKSAMTGERNVHDSVVVWLPFEVERAIRLFDYGIYVEPFFFEFDWDPENAL